MIKVSRVEAKLNGLKHYYTGKPCNHGHISERYTLNCTCVSCCKYSDKRRDVKKTASRKKKYYLTNLETIKEYALSNKGRRKKWEEDNKEKIAENRRAWRKNNKEKIADYSRRYDLDNKELVIERDRKYRRDNPLLTFTRGSLRRIEKAKGSNRINRSEIEIGYTQSDFKKHIESLFSDGMSWGNRSKWHIDHIVPVSWWLKNGVTDVSMINALINLQPLWAIDNLTKGAKI